MIYCGTHQADHTAEEFAACLNGTLGQDEEEQ